MLTSARHSTAHEKARHEGGLLAMVRKGVGKSFFGLTQSLQIIKDCKAMVVVIVCDRELSVLVTVAGATATIKPIREFEPV